MLLYNNKEAIVIGFAKDVDYNIENMTMLF